MKRFTNFLRLFIQRYKIILILTIIGLLLPLLWDVPVQQTWQLTKSKEIILNSWNNFFLVSGLTISLALVGYQLGKAFQIKNSWLISIFNIINPLYVSTLINQNLEPILFLFAINFGLILIKNIHQLNLLTFVCYLAIVKVLVIIVSSYEIGIALVILGLLFWWHAIPQSNINLSGESSNVFKIIVSQFFYYRKKFFTALDFNFVNLSLRNTKQHASAWNSLISKRRAFLCLILILPHLWQFEKLKVATFVRVFNAESPSIYSLFPFELLPQKLQELFFAYYNSEAGIITFSIILISIILIWVFGKREERFFSALFIILLILIVPSTESIHIKNSRLFLNHLLFPIPSLQIYTNYALLISFASVAISLFTDKLLIRKNTVLKVSLVAFIVTILILLSPPLFLSQILMR